MEKDSKVNLPVVIHQDEEGFFVAECPLLKGCCSQGKTMDEALENIREVIDLCLEEEDEDCICDICNIKGFSFHTVSVEL